MNQDLKAIACRPSLLPEFLYYWISGQQRELLRKWSQVGATVDSIDVDVMRNTLMATPSIGEQGTIVAYLDRETDRIDTLIEEKERFVALLREKRATMIWGGVTKGIEESTPLRESTVGWAGLIPHHWKSGAILRFAKLQSGHTPTRDKAAYWENCVHPWVSLSDVGQFRGTFCRQIDDTREKISDLGLANSAARLLPKGTVILSRTASVGYAVKLGRVMATTQDFANWICGPELNSDYLLLCFWAMTSEFERLKCGSTHSTIYMPDIKALTIPLPPKEEQNAIARHVFAEIDRTTRLIEEVQESIRLLTERRAALITAAVTGQIDVTGDGQKETEGAPLAESVAS